MPTAPGVEYLARPVSSCYAILGALGLVMAADLELPAPGAAPGVTVAVMSVVNSVYCSACSRSSTQATASSLLRCRSPRC
jgi:hypothetical protein